MRSTHELQRRYYIAMLCAVNGVALIAYGCGGERTNAVAPAEVEVTPSESEPKREEPQQPSETTSKAFGLTVLTPEGFRVKVKKNTQEQFEIMLWKPNENAARSVYYLRASQKPLMETMTTLSPNQQGTSKIGVCLDAAAVAWAQSIASIRKPSLARQFSVGRGDDRDDDFKVDFVATPVDAKYGSRVNCCGLILEHTKREQRLVVGVAIPGVPGENFWALMAAAKDLKITTTEIEN